MNKFAEFIGQVANLQFIFKLLVLWGLACIAPFALLVARTPEAGHEAVVQAIVAYILLFLYFGRFIQVNNAPQSEEKAPQ